LSDFDPSTNPIQGTWSTKTSTGFTGRYGATSCQIGGKIYVMGGADNSLKLLSALEVFDPTAETWSAPTTTGTLTPLFQPACAEVGGKIYVMGGFSGSFSAPKIENVLEVFDPATNSW